MGKHNYTVNSETIGSDLLACKKSFDTAKIPWVIMGGIVLGYSRYKKIMEWDTDLDVGVFVEITSSSWAKLYKALSDNKFKIEKSKKDFICGGRETPFNLWFFHKKGNFYESYPKQLRSKKIKFVEKGIWYDEPQTVEFLGDKYPMPNHMNDYLICQYGEDWETNIVKDHEAYYLDKRGSRDTSKWLSSKANKYGELWPKTLRFSESMEDVE